MKSRILFWTLLTLVGCTEDKKQECGPKPFAGPYSAFFQPVVGLPVERNQNCFYHFILKYSHDTTLNGYWGIKDDTIFVIKQSDTSFSKPQKIPFLVKSLNPGDMYTYYSYVQGSDGLVALGNVVEVTILSKKIDKYDTTIEFAHTCVPNSIPKNKAGYPQYERKFLFSYKHGVLNFTERKIGDVSSLKFDW